MNGYPDSNFAAFNEATIKLRKVGYEVITPHEHDLAAGSVQDWQRTLTRDLSQFVCCVDGIAALPKFYESKGACLEVHTALALGKSIELIPGQTEVWRTRVLEWARVSLAAMWREVDHNRYEDSHQVVAKAINDRPSNARDNPSKGWL